MSKFKRYERYKDSGIEWIGEIPEHWGVIKLKYVTKLAYGDSLPTENREEEGEVDVFGSNGKVGTHNVANTLSPVIIVGRKGSYGKVTYSDKKCFAIDTTYYIDNRCTKSNIKWLYYSLMVLELDKNSQDTGVPGLSREYAYNKYVPVPTVNEQAAIANFLDQKTAEIDDLIADKEKLIELLQEKRQAIITEAVTKGLNPNVRMKDSGIDWIGGIPEHWHVKKIKYLAFLKSGESITSEMIEEQGEYPVYGGNGLRGYTSSYTHDGNYVLIGRQGALCGNINYAQGKFWASEHAVVVTPLGDVDLIWLGELLRSMNLNQYSISAAQPGLSVTTIQNLFIPVPPHEEQRAISYFLKQKIADIEEIIQDTRKQIIKLKEYRQSLISEAITGKIDVREFANISEVIHQ